MLQRSNHQICGQPLTSRSNHLNSSHQFLSLHLGFIVIREVGTDLGGVVQVDLAALLQVKHLRRDLADGTDDAEEDNYWLNGDG